MTKTHDTTGARVLVGIDISKHRHEVLIAVPGKTRRRRMTVLNTAADYQRLIEALCDLELPVTIGFEAALLRKACLGFTSVVQRHSWAACPSLRPPAIAP